MRIILPIYATYLCLLMVLGIIQPVDTYCACANATDVLVDGKCLHIANGTLVADMPACMNKDVIIANILLIFYPIVAWAFVCFFESG